jgi:hypothetical protein
MTMPGRSFTATTVANTYRYGQNTQEKTPEIAPNTYTAEFWQYDARIVRRWNVDPRSNLSMSPYACFGGNPILYSDVKGDSIPASFGTSSGQSSNQIPEVVQKQFQQEYGITLGYENGKLFKAGDFKTDKKVSQSAKQEWENVLGSTNSDIKLVFGYEIATGMNPTKPVTFTSPVSKGLYIENQKTAFIDLADFRDDGTIFGAAIAYGSDKNKKLDYSITSRSNNLARVLEHEFLKHGICKMTDDDPGLCPTGEVEYEINKFRIQMGVPTMNSYKFTSDVTNPTGEKISLMNNSQRSILRVVTRDFTDANGNIYTQQFDLTPHLKATRFVNSTTYDK